MFPTPLQLAETYFALWTEGDLDRMRDILAPDVTFRGALGVATGVDECIAGLTGMRTILTGIDVKARVADATDVITWFDLHTTEAPPTPTANWQHVENGRIVAINVAFDPRAILGIGSDGN